MVAAKLACYTSIDLAAKEKTSPNGFRELIIYTERKIKIKVMSVSHIPGCHETLSNQRGPMTDT